MACSLARDATGRFDFLAGAGQNITVKVAATGNARFVSASQNGNKFPIVDENTVQFTVLAGENAFLFVVAVADPDDTVKVLEDCGTGESNLLEQFKNDPNDPVTGFSVFGA
jgi:hypothetical protein